MDARRPAEGVTAALEREIEAALAVDPSPEFVAKVRARVANEPPPASWWPLRWPVVVGAVATAGVVMAVALAWPTVEPNQLTTTGGADIVLIAPTLETAGPRLTGTQATGPRAQPRRSSPTASEGGSGPAELPGRTVSPEVLISRDEQRGLELLLTAVRDGRITPTIASQLTAGDAALDAMDIALSDIVIQPLQQLAALEGEGQ